MGGVDDVEVPTRRWTRLEYDRLVEAEFFRPDDRIELLGGHMVVKEPQDSPHAAGMPHPTSAALVGEVALSRLRFDHETKGSLYARARIGDYRTVNIPDRRLEVYRDPIADAAAPFGWRYGRAMAPGADDHVSPHVLPAVAIPVGRLLPPVTRR